MIGFVDLGEININYATFENVQKLAATHVIVFLVKSVVNPLSYSFATFATDKMTTFQIMPIFWQAVKYLERINLKVIAATADRASQKRKCFTMHKYLCGDSDADVIYCTKNIHTKEMRFIYFFADALHLVKTVRNCLFLINGFFEQWFFFSFMVTYSLYYEDLESGLKLVNKLTSDQINLTSYSVMRFNLAAQVRSETVGNVLNNFSPEEAKGTGQFCIMIGKSFDCLKIQNTKEHIIKKKHF